MGAATTTILRAVWDRKLFRPWFRDAASWAGWFTFLRALFALPMGETDLATYRACTGRTAPPTRTATEAWLICGRRAGKSFMLALTLSISRASMATGSTWRLVSAAPS